MRHAHPLVRSYRSTTKPGAQTGKQVRPVGLFQLTLDIVVSNKLAAFFESLPLSFNLVPPRERETRKDKTKEKRLERDQGVASSISHRPDLAGSARWRVGGNFPRQPKCGTGLPSRRWFEIRLTSAATAGSARAARKRIALQPHVADSAARI